MIIVDFSGIAVASVFSQKTNNVNEDLVRHQILNSLRMYNVKYRRVYGEMIIACDGGSWRKNVFEEYKAARKTNREKSDIDWDAVWESINKIKQEITDHLPYKVIRVKGAEADDIIAAMVETKQEFGTDEKVMIVSADKDFVQLQKYSNVEQFSPMTKKKVTDKNPRRYLMEHILRGDSGDGVPNVLSPDNVFLTDARQKPLTKAKVENWINNFGSIDKHMSKTEYRNFVRNRRVIDLSYIPEELFNEIYEEYEKQPDVPNSKVLPYLISKKSRMLISSAADFFSNKTK